MVQVVITLLLGLITGLAAGLVGVGGGEFRIPVLLHVLRLPVRAAAGVNLVVGLFTVTLSLARRWGTMAWTREYVELAVVMSVASVVGAALGPRLARAIRPLTLRRFVCAYLIVVGIWMVDEAMAGADFHVGPPTGVWLWAVGAVTALAIAALSALLGVAGGEMRIPALMILFALPVKAAGTVSLLVSTFTVGAGGAAYRKLGELPNRYLPTALILAAGSAVGVLIGVSLLSRVDSHSLKGILGGVLLLAAVALLLTRRPAD